MLAEEKEDKRYTFSIPQVTENENPLVWKGSNALKYPSNQSNADCDECLLHVVYQRFETPPRYQGIPFVSRKKKIPMGDKVFISYPSFHVSCNSSNIKDCEDMDDDFNPHKGN